MIIQGGSNLLLSYVFQHVHFRHLNRLKNENIFMFYFQCDSFKFLCLSMHLWPRFNIPCMFGLSAQFFVSALNFVNICTSQFLRPRWHSLSISVFIIMIVVMLCSWIMVVDHSLSHDHNGCDHVSWPSIVCRHDHNGW